MIRLHRNSPSSRKVPRRRLPAEWTTCQPITLATARTSRSAAPATLNAAAERAWAAYLADRDHILRPEQAARMRRVMDAAVEPGHVH
ncbi:MAG TPA: hypothetical protein VHG08_14295 [Longimicrobium sp.]|nr:hypothetical protein [Longimicrobium sp.]